MKQNEVTELFRDFVGRDISMRTKTSELLHIWSGEPYDGSPVFTFQEPDDVGLRVVCAIEGVAKRNQMVLGTFSQFFVIPLPPKQLIILTDELSDAVWCITGFKLQENPPPIQVDGFGY